MVRLKSQTALITPRKNQDVRIATAYNIFEIYQNNILLTHKTTRAGCTTALAAESLNREEPFLMVVPTNNIAQKTIVQDAQKYSDMKDSYIIHIKSNHFCLRNEELCEIYPDLKRLPILPLPGKCTECEYYDYCPITEILRKPHANGYVLTYQKLVALLLSMGHHPNTTAEKIIDIVSGCKNIVFDEIHEIQYGKSSSLTVYDDSDDKNKRIDFSKYIHLHEDYKYIFKLLTNFKMLLNEEEIESNIQGCKWDADDEDHWKHHINRQLVNNWTTLSIKENGDETKTIIAIYEEIIDLTKNRTKYDLKIYDILDIYKILNIVTSESISLTAVKDNGNTKVNMIAVDIFFANMIKSFIQSIENKDKRMFLTSATICSFDYSKLLMDHKQMLKITFGLGGDPMNTNDKMLIIADKKRYNSIGTNSYFKKKDEILMRIKMILGAYGPNECKIVAMNIKHAIDLQKDLDALGIIKEVTYYKAPELMGVSAKERVLIAVGMAYKPANAYDGITTTLNSSRTLLYESIQSDTWQAWSRVKDPSGTNPSLIFALGCRGDACKNITRWGYGRNIDIDDNNHSVQIENECITHPKIIECNDFDEMIIAGNEHKAVFCKDNLTMLNKFRIAQKNCNGNSGDQLKYMVSVINKKCLIIYSNRHFSLIMDTIYLKSDLINLIVNRKDAFIEQGRDGKYFRVSSEISDTLIENHTNHKITIGSYFLDNKNMVKCIAFDVDSHPDEDATIEQTIQSDEKAEEDLVKLTDHLTQNNIPHITEASGSKHSYHIWILLQPIKAKIAKQFGKLILKSAGVKCELFPKQEAVSRKGYGNAIKLPFGLHKKNGNISKIMIDNECIDDFEEMQVGILDISDFEMPEKTKTKRKNIEYSKIENVRPCIKDALNKDLIGSDGHMMRIAIVREFFNFGMTDPGELVELFKNQSDYDYEISLNKVLSIIKDDYKIWHRDTLNEHCESFINCSECDYMPCKNR
jgi:hypothetical protein